MSGGRGRGEEGSVTVTVVAVTALMAAIAASLLTLARPTAGLAHLDIEALHRKARIEAGLNAAAFHLFYAGEAPADLDGRRWAVDGGSVRIDVSPEKGRVDLNTSEPDLLARVFSASGASSLTRQAFAARVADWRDADSEKTIEGAEGFEYEAAGAPPPADAPFRSVDELRFLLGLSEDDFARVEPYLTTYNRDGTVRPEDAAGPVRAALFGTALRPTALFREAGPEDAPPEAPPMAPGGGAGTAPEAFRVEIEEGLRADGSARGGAVAIIAPPAAPGEAYALLEWHDRAADGTETEEGAP